jgi:cysteine-rich repeat protein
MHASRSFPTLVSLLGLTSLPALFPLACAPDLTGDLTGSGSAGGASSSAGSGGDGGAGGSAGAGGSPGTCGNGVLEDGEECDDANALPGDGCTGCVACKGEGDFLDPESWHCYTYVTGAKKSWSEARAACKARGGDLAAISTPGEHDFLEPKTTTDAWLGGTDEVTECVFEWSNGEPWYPNWYAGEPNDFLNEEDCVSLYGSGKFRDVDCQIALDYLCERVPQGVCGDGIVQSGEECDDGNLEASDGCDDCKVACAAGEIKNSNNLHCYRVVTNAEKAWDDAKLACGNGGYLAVVTSPEEVNFLMPHLKDKTWLGMRRDPQSSSYAWTTKEPTCWQNWAPSEPSSEFVEYCVETLPNGTWNDTQCGWQRDYICERSPLGN